MPSHKTQRFGKNSVISVILIPLCSTYDFHNGGGGGGGGGGWGGGWGKGRRKQEMSPAAHFKWLLT